MQELFYTIMAIACAVAALTIFYLAYNTAESKALRKACEHCNAYLKELEIRNNELRSKVDKAEQKSAMYYAVNKSLKETLDVIHSEHTLLTAQWTTIEKAYDQLLVKVEKFAKETDEMTDWEASPNQLDIFNQEKDANTKPME
jgi:chromosome segregation ATPase